MISKEIYILHLIDWRLYYFQYKQKEIESCLHWTWSDNDGLASKNVNVAYWFSFRWKRRRCNTGKISGKKLKLWLLNVVHYYYTIITLLYWYIVVYDRNKLFLPHFHVYVFLWIGHCEWIYIDYTACCTSEGIKRAIASSSVISYAKASPVLLRSSKILYFAVLCMIISPYPCVSYFNVIYLFSKHRFE